MNNVKKPNFLIVGAPKSGTTAMYDMLRQHPDIFMPGIKEPLYFSDIGGITTVREYYGLFKGRKEKALGEASTNYLSSKNAAKRIYETLGKIKIIVMLRDPISQIWSMYLHNIRNGYESLPFEDALSMENSRKQNREDPCFYYRERARYCAQLKKYIEVFGNENVHIIIYEDFKQNQLRSVRDVFEFLLLPLNIDVENKYVNFHGDPIFPMLHKLIIKKNFLWKFGKVFPKKSRQRFRRIIRDKNIRPKKPPEMNSSIRELLASEYCKEIEDISNLLGRNMLQSWNSINAQAISNNLKI